MTLRKAAFLGCFGTVLLMVHCEGVWGDTYHLRGGSVIKGQEVGRDANGLKVETSEGVQLIPWANLLSITRGDDDPYSEQKLQSSPSHGTVTVHLKNGQRLRGIMVAKDQNKVVLESKGVKLTIAQSDIESIEDFSTLPSKDMGGAPFSGAEMMKNLPAEVVQLLEELGNRCKNGFGGLDAFSGHLVLKINLGSLMGASVVPSGAQSFSAEADVWGAKGDKFRLELSAKDPNTGELFSLAMASDGQTGLGRVMAPGEQEEQYFALDMAQFKSMAEQTAATQAPLQAQQMAQLQELAKEIAVAKGEPKEIAAGLAEPYRMTIVTGEIPNMPGGISMDSLEIAIWMGMEDDLLYRVDVGIPGAAELLVLEFTRMDRDPKISSQLFTIQVPEGVVPQDVGQMFSMGMMGAMGNMGGMGIR